MVQDNSISLVVSRSHSLSPYIAPLCQEARQTTFAPEQLLQQYKDGVIGSRKGSRKAATFLNVNEKYSGGAVSHSVTYFSYYMMVVQVKVDVHS